MPATDIAVVVSEQAMSDWSEVGGKIGNHQGNIDQNWDEHIDDGSDSYSMQTYGTTLVTVDIGDHDTLDSALDAAQSDLQGTDIQNNYDCVIVLDSRTYSDGIGRAFISRAGTDWGVAIVANDGDNQTAPHEAAHLYGATHSDFESTELHHSIMGKYGNVDCNDNTSYTTSGDWFGPCTISAVRDYIDSSENI